MSRLIGESLESVMKSHKQLNITYPSADETLYGTPEIIPTSEPGTAQVIYTISSSHLPTLSFEPINKKLLAGVVVSGKNLTASSQTLNYRVLKNGTSLTTGTLSIAANYYWTLSIYNSALNNIAENDEIDIALWTANSNSLDLRYKACFVTCDGIQLEKINQVLLDLQYTVSSTSYPSLTLGTPGAMYGSGSAMRVYADNNTKYFTNIGNGIFTIKAFVIGSTYLSHALQLNTSINANTHASYMPYYAANVRVTSISWRPTSIEL